MSICKGRERESFLFLFFGLLFVGVKQRKRESEDGEEELEKQGRRGLFGSRES